jgi:hypothetical protein
MSEYRIVEYRNKFTCQKKVLWFFWKNMTFVNTNKISTFDSLERAKTAIDRSLEFHKEEPKKYHPYP